MDLKSIGLRIKNCRRLNKLTQEGLAELAEVSPHYIYEIEKGMKMMSLPTLEKLSTHLNISADYLLFGENQLCATDNAASTSDRLFVATCGLSISEREHIADILEVMIPYLK